MSEGAGGAILETGAKVVTAVATTVGKAAEAGVTTAGKTAELAAQATAKVGVSTAETVGYVAETGSIGVKIGETASALARAQENHSSLLRDGDEAGQATEAVNIAGIRKDLDNLLLQREINGREGDGDKPTLKRRLVWGVSGALLEGGSDAVDNVSDDVEEETKPK